MSNRLLNAFFDYQSQSLGRDFGMKVIHKPTGAALLLLIEYPHGNVSVLNSDNKLLKTFYREGAFLFAVHYAHTTLLYNELIQDENDLYEDNSNF